MNSTQFLQTPNFTLAYISKGNPDSKKLALVLPGRLDTKDYIHITSHVDMLARKGFYAVSFDPPYTWDSPGDIKNYSSTNYIKAVQELIEHFGNRSTLLVGHSRGGAIAQLCSDNPRIVGLVLAMASYEAPTAPDLAKTDGDTFMDVRDLPPGETRTKNKKQMATPMSYFRDAVQYNQVEVLKKFLGPKLMICGTRDEFITPEKVKKVFDSLNEPKVYLELDSVHDYRLDSNILERINGTIADFVDKYLEE